MQPSADKFKNSDVKDVTQFADPEIQKAYYITRDLVQSMKKRLSFPQLRKTSEDGDFERDTLAEGEKVSKITDSFPISTSHAAQGI